MYFFIQIWLTQLQIESKNSQPSRIHLYNTIACKSSSYRKHFLSNFFEYTSISNISK